MKRQIKKLSMALAAMMLIVSVATSCGDQNKEDNATTKSTVKTVAKGALPNYRYVDLDTILSKYHLANDYDEELLRMQTNMENTVRQKQASLQSVQENMQRKYQNNEYQTETQVRNEQKKLENMMQQADKEVATLQGNFQNQAMQFQKTVSDSIQAFIQRYNAKKGYDAIFFKNATLYINPELDITKEVLEGLNASYNKIGAK